MKINLDKVGMTCSTVCFWHCILFPFLFAIFPMVTFFRSEVFEWSFISFGIAVAAFAMLQGYAQHRKRMPIALAITGFTLFVAAHLYAEGGHFHAEGVNYTHLLLSLLAGCIIFSAHYVNHKFINRACSCDHQHS